MILGLLALLGADAIASEIVGVVTDDRGLPIAGVLVLAYDDRVKYQYDYSLPDGSFRIEDLDPGPHRVRYISPDNVDAVEMYQGGLSKLCKAELVEVLARGTVDLGTVPMAPGGILRGRVLDPAGAPVVGAEVVSRPAGVTPTALPRSAWTDETGAFELRGVPVEADGTAWNLEVIPEAAPEQYLGPSFSVDTASIFEVAIGTPLDVGEWTLLPGGSLSGTAIGPDGPLVEGTVNAVTVGRTWTAPVVDGAWEFAALPPGAARIWVTAPGHATTFYPDSPTPGATVTVTDALATEGVALTLAPEARFTGRLAVPDDVTGTTITLVDPARSVQTTVSVAADGTFLVDRMGAGTWRVEVTPAEELPYVWGPLLTSEGNLLEITLEPGEELDAGELPLPEGATIRGVTRDRSSGDPIYGAWVYVENASTGTSRLVYSGKKGHYEARRLPAGVYRVHAEYEHYCRGDRDWVARHYPDQRNGVLTGTLPLAAGQVVHWSPKMPYDVDHDKMGDGWEDGYGLKVGKRDGLDDLDGDGFSNLDEYLLGTDPSDGRGCDGGCAGGGSWLALFPLVAFTGRRRSMARGDGASAAQPPTHPRPR